MMMRDGKIGGDNDQHWDDVHTVGTFGGLEGRLSGEAPGGRDSLPINEHMSPRNGKAISFGADAQDQFLSFKPPAQAKQQNLDLADTFGGPIENTKFEKQDVGTSFGARKDK